MILPREQNPKLKNGVTKLSKQLEYSLFKFIVA